MDMDINSINRNVLELGKKALDKTYSVIDAVQKQTEKIAVSVADKSPWLREPGKIAITEWLESYQKGIEGIKKATDRNYEMMIAYFSKDEESGEMNEKSEEAKERKTAKTKRRRVR